MGEQVQFKFKELSGKHLEHEINSVLKHIRNNCLPTYLI